MTLLLAAQSLYRLRESPFSAQCHRGSMRLFGLVVSETLRRAERQAMRHLAGVTKWLARGGTAVEGFPKLRESLEHLAAKAAQELLVRHHAGTALSGREVGQVCEAVVRLGLRNDLFVAYVRRLLRRDWDLIWPPRALIDAALFLQHFEQKEQHVFTSHIHARRTARIRNSNLKGDS